MGRRKFIKKNSRVFQKFSALRAAKIKIEFFFKISRNSEISIGIEKLLKLLFKKPQLEVSRNAEKCVFGRENRR